MRPLGSSTLLGVGLAALLCGSLSSLVSQGARAAARRTERATIWAQVEQRCKTLAAEPLPPYPWPIAPVNRQHPVRGYFEIHAP